MNEAETRAEHIDPALKASGWGEVEGSRVRREYVITPGRIEGQGRRGNPLKADYVLEYRNTKLGVIEAKAWIAFQIAWKLFSARWNLNDWKSGAEPTRRPRILFLADRNTLADQAYNDFTSFAAFAEDALARIKPDEIRKKGKVPKNASIFFTIFQTFMRGEGPDGEPAPYFGEYPPDFFDF